MQLLRIAGRLTVSSTIYCSYLCASKILLETKRNRSSNNIVLMSSSSSSSSSPKKHFNAFLSLDLEGLPDTSSRTSAAIPPSSFSLVMANSLTMDVDIARRVWKHCDYRICADGGANRLFDGMSAMSASQVEQFIPDAVKGDLDSLRPDVRDYYSLRGSTIIRDGDQDSNDLDKCIAAVLENHKDKHKGQEIEESDCKPLTLIILGAFGGRLDQEMASIHSLYRWQGSFHRIVLIGGENVACLLGPGTHICIPVRGVEGPGVSLLPIGGKVDCITTEGLQWDLSSQSLEMGLLISSSNRIKDESTTGSVAITTSHSVLWHTLFTLHTPETWRI